MAFRGLARVVPMRSLTTLLTPQQRRFYSQQEGKAEDEKARSEDPSSPSAEDARLKDLESKFKALEKESYHYKDLYIRAIAEQENIRKRLSKEVENEGNYSITKFAKEMLEVSDNLNRAIENTTNDKIKDDPKKSIADLIEGVAMTRDILKNAFGKFNITEFNPTGEKFDPNFHEALLAYEDKKKEPGSVGQVFMTGYKIKDRVLRVAKVGVVKK
jgi:molecular chaperone GrpE